MNADEKQTIRDAIIQSLPSDTSLHGHPPERQYVYVPPSHVKALRLECSLVIGGRGVGKTFWSAALRSEEVRRMLGQTVSGLLGISVWDGYGERIDLDAYPDADTFDDLISEDIEPYHVWRAVLGRRVAEFLSEEIPRERWAKTVEWVKREPETFARLLQQANDRLDTEARDGLIVLDALDRSNRDWHTMDVLVRDLLRVVLSLKPFRRLHGKVFLREDQFDDRPIADFPDASKITATRVELTWGLEDLHGLLWQYLCNGPDKYGEILRSIYASTIGSEPLVNDGGWVLDDRVKRSRDLQRLLFIELAGEWMGRNRRRGNTYTWIVGHLADSRGRVSPRSFLAAVRAAAEDSRERHPDYGYPLHYESIKRGVQKASEIRVAELAEDYPWINVLMNPLQGLTVPCEFKVIEDCWKEKGDYPKKELFSNRLPPEHWEKGWNGIMEDLVSLGILEIMKDGRINMPDLYRVGFGLGRRGGVKPVARMTKR